MNTPRTESAAGDWPEDDLTDAPTGATPTASSHTTPQVPVTRFTISNCRDFKVKTNRSGTLDNCRAFHINKNINPRNIDSCGSVNRLTYSNQTGFAVRGNFGGMISNCRDFSISSDNAYSIANSRDFTISKF